MTSVVDVHEVEANAQTRLLVPRILNLHEYGLYCPFFGAIYHFIFMRKHHSPFRLIISRTHHDLERL